MAIQHNFALQLIPILLDMVMLDHDNHHIHFVKELVEIQDLVLDNLLLGEERVEAL